MYLLWNRNSSKIGLNCSTITVAFKGRFMGKEMKKKASLKKSKVSAAVKKAWQMAGPGFHGYDFILLVDPRSAKAEIIGGTPAEAYLHLYKKEPIHQQALQQALQKGVHHYEWAGKKAGGQAWFQTTCILLSLPDGKPSGVLCLTRDISRLGVAYAGSGVAEWSSPKTFSQILLAAREAEKKEISKALHDEVGSSSVILTALLSLVKVSVQNGNIKRALRDIKQLDEQIKQGVERLRNIIVSLRPPTLDNPGGLCGAIHDLLENISALSHIPYDFHCDTKNELELTENVRILLFRIVQEALTNIVKHAHAKHIEVMLKRVGSKVRLVVADDGVGFNPSQSVSIEHVGLLAMKDSVELLGGKIVIKSALGKGTRIEVACPSAVYGGKN